jgi:hypothetical protein
LNDRGVNHRWDLSRVRSVFHLEHTHRCRWCGARRRMLQSSWQYQPPEGGRWSSVRPLCGAPRAPKVDTRQALLPLGGLA